ncbi:MAG: WYL domain-containing protein, partial [Actinobacteria bacterium]|nr:WYL domain-containing protein [Actinomycetota bacterium]
MSKELAIECEYINQTGAKSSRTIDPLRIDFIGRRHYLRGFCRTSGELRAFRLDRIQSLSITGISIPEKTKGLSIPQEVFGEVTEEQIVEIAASAEAAEIFWNFPVAGNTKRTGDQLQGSIRVGNLEALGRHVAKYGGMVKV